MMSISSMLDLQEHLVEKKLYQCMHTPLSGTDNDFLKIKMMKTINVKELDIYLLKIYVNKTSL